jgi:predicted phosphodiesterase
MERTRNIKKPDLILTADWHLREDTPVCWIGDFDEEQWNSVLFVNRLQAQYDCPVIHAGDLFNHWKPSPYLLTRTIKYLPKRFYTIYGQHDLPQHNLDLAIKSGINTLEQAGVLKIMAGCHFGQEPPKEPNNWTLLPMIGSKPISILVWHHLTYITPPFPGATGGNAISILMKYSQFDLIVTGDNHQSFSTGSNIANILVNPGSLTRQTADQIDFQPRVALWYAEDNKIVWINIPIAKDVISREHIEKVEQRDARIDAFVSSFKEDYEVGLSFEQNLEEFFNKNNVRDSVKQIIYESIE